MSDRSGAALLREDDVARKRSLDITCSFLVQAPAGSGKTELLIQRFLALLSRVEAPERVVALTFTRKAAGEMRERVGRALIDARDGKPVADAHARQTRSLAEAVLAQDTKCGWNLVENASRLQMLTFDALGAWFARRAPMAAKLGPDPAYVDDAGALYRAAVQAAIAGASEDDAHWRSLLVHLDNQSDRVTDLMANLLAKRDQWFRLDTAKDIASLRAGMEVALRAEIEHVLTSTRDAFPPGTGAAIADSARNASTRLAEISEQREYAESLVRCARDGGLPAATIDAVPQWKALAQFLMVKDGTRFRERIDRSNGFPAPGKDADADERRARKDAMASLCARLEQVPGLAVALSAVRVLPSSQLPEASWAIVEALLQVLWQATVQLHLVFGEAGEIDYVQGTLAALEALGETDDPSDLLLRLDARIDHLLVDEFQDTSLAQLDLLRRLTAGWQHDDGRTLFAVGDPMQSIYRFREAEVRLFVEAQREGAIAGIAVESLRLRRNFRSQPALVRWVNETFPTVLGDKSDAARGAVAFAPAVPGHDAPATFEPTVDLCATGDEEADKVIERIRESRSAGATDIAVLVRARTHLATLLPALRRAGVAIAAVELDRLSDRQSVRDLVALTHALLQPADHAAWFAVLRAPWCGLALRDLTALAELAHRERCSLAALLVEPASFAPAEADGRARLERAMAALRPALAARGHATVAARVRGAWLALGGPACLDDPLDLEAAECFFALIPRYESGGDLPDWDAFCAALDELRAAPETADAAGVKVMTMHKAKGLQFDTVILPGLGRGGRSDDPPLVRWRRRDKGLLIAPGKARGDEPDPVYAYLSCLEKQEQDAELGRLLYVACTRARSRLHLTAVPRTFEDSSSGTLRWKPTAGSSLAKLWPALKVFQDPLESRSMRPDALVAEPIVLRRLPLAWSAATANPGLGIATITAKVEPFTPPFEWAAETARWIGTLAHRLLARIAADGIDAWTPQRVATLLPRVRTLLANTGFASDELHGACEKVLETVRRTLADPRGRWIFDAKHEDARSEWALAGIDNGVIVHVIVDRTFVADGVRWVVDFKTSAHEGADTESFLDSEEGRYRDQLARYGRLMQGLDEHPVRVALYYPLIDGGFRQVGGPSPSGGSPTDAG